jgi:hypothetical protein
MKNTLLSASILAIGLVATATANAGPKPGNGPKGGGFQPSNVIHNLPIQPIGMRSGPMQSGQVLNFHTNGQPINMRSGPMQTGQVLNLHTNGLQFNTLPRNGNGQLHILQSNSTKTFTRFFYPYHSCYYPWWFGCGYGGYPSYWWWDYGFFPWYGF